MNIILDVEINKILRNLEKISYNKKPCIAVKGNCYGVGLELINILIDKGYDFFCVSTIDEADYIRKISKEVEILILTTIFEEDLEYVREKNYIFTVSDIEILGYLKESDRFHIKIDIGMGRLGISVLEANKNKNEILKYNPEGIYAHLPDYQNEELTINQIYKFEKLIEEYKYNFKYIHIKASHASLKYKTDFDNMIRPGIAMYGLFSDKKESTEYDLEEALSLKVKIGMIKEYSGKIGYSGIDNVSGNVATLFMGYHDGLKQEYRGYELAEGKIVGKICMCQFMMLLKDKKKAKEYIEIFGKKNSIYKLAEYSNVSIYEVISTLSSRVYKNYIGEK